MVRFAPAVERTSVGAPPPWPVASAGAPSLVLLSGDATDRDIGAVVWQLAQYNGIAIEGRPIDAILRDIVAAESLVLPGGIAVRDSDGREIVPGCCAGIEEWREWLAFEVTGESPWMGHEPDPWLERVGDVVRVWAHGELAQGERGAPFAIELSIAEFRRALAGVERDLQAFLHVLRAWGRRHAPTSAAEELATRFDAAFKVTAGQDGGAVT